MKGRRSDNRRSD